MKWKTFWRDNCPKIENALFDTLKRIFPDAQHRWLKGMAAVLQYIGIATKDIPIAECHH
jgi:hypothetical protein